MSKDLSNSKNRDKLKKSSFALPDQEKYPIPDIEHARNALARVAQNGSEAEQKKVRAAVENMKGFVGTAGVFNFTPADHNGLDVDAFEMVTVKNGKFVLLGK